MILFPKNCEVPGNPIPPEIHLVVLLTSCINPLSSLWGPRLLTWLESDLAEHHPCVGKMVLAFDGTSHSVVERHCDKPSTGVHVIQNKGKGDGSRFPLTGFRAEVALDLLKDLHTFSKHVVAVDLAERGHVRGRLTPLGCKGEHPDRPGNPYTCLFLWMLPIIQSSGEWQW